MVIDSVVAPVALVSWAGEHKPQSTMGKTFCLQLTRTTAYRTCVCKLDQCWKISKAYSRGMTAGLWAPTVLGIRHVATSQMLIWQHAPSRIQQRQGKNRKSDGARVDPWAGPVSHAISSHTSLKRADSAVFRHMCGCARPFTAAWYVLRTPQACLQAAIWWRGHVVCVCCQPFLRCPWFGQSMRSAAVASQQLAGASSLIRSTLQMEGAARCICGMAVLQ